MDADGNRPVGFFLFLLGGLSGLGLAVADQPFPAVEEIRIRQAAAQIMEIVVCLHAVLAVDRVCDDVVDLRGIEKLSTLAPDAVVPAVSLRCSDRIAVEQELIEQPGEPYLFRIDDEEGVLFIAALLPDGLHAAGASAAGPLPGSAQGVHIVCHALGGVFPLQLGECREDIHDGPAHGRGGVERFLYRDKGNIVLLEDLVHGGEFLHVAADPVELVDHHHIQYIFFDIVHQLLKAGAVHILPGEAFVLIIDFEGDISVLENNAGVVLAELYLDADRITVIAVYGFSGIDPYSEHTLILLYILLAAGHKNVRHSSGPLRCW